MYRLESCHRRGFHSRGRSPQAFGTRFPCSRSRAGARSFVFGNYVVSFGFFVYPSTPVFSTATSLSSAQRIMTCRSQTHVSMWCHLFVAHDWCSSLYCCRSRRHSLVYQCAYCLHASWLGLPSSMCCHRNVVISVVCNSARRPIGWVGVPR